MPDCNDTLRELELFLDKELWQHFGSEERVLEALRMLVSLAERSSRSVA